MQNKLQMGDVFRVTKNFGAYLHVPQKYVYGWKQHEEGTFGTRDTRVGERLETPLTAQGELHVLDTSVFAGEYVVESAKMSGGGTGHGPGDVYPDGWYVTGRQLRPDGSYDPNGRMLSFYQSGSFTIVHADVTAVRKMTRSVGFV